MSKGTTEAHCPWLGLCSEQPKSTGGKVLNPFGGTRQRGGEPGRAPRPPHLAAHEVSVDAATRDVPWERKIPSKQAARHLGAPKKDHPPWAHHTFSPPGPRGGLVLSNGLKHGSGLCRQRHGVLPALSTTAKSNGDGRRDWQRFRPRSFHP